MTTQIDFQRHLQIRDRIRGTLNQLRAEGVTVGELIEGLRNELTLLHIEDDASADELDTRSADASQTTDKES